MKNVLRFVGIGLALVLIGVAGLLAYTKLCLPSVGDAPKIEINATAAQIERGRYLANHVNACIDCHSSRDWSRFSGPPIAGTFGKGGDLFGPEDGFPGLYYVRNITPAGISHWSDGEIFRAISAGVTRDGKAIFPVMPYQKYGFMDQTDVKSIVAYVRMLRSIPNKIPASISHFPMNFILNTIPQKPTFQKRPDTTAVLEYGKYLVNAAACGDCHTKQEKGAPAEGAEFAGGREFGRQGTVMRSANITPDN